MIPRAKKQLRPDIEKPFATEFATQIFRGCDMRLIAGPNAKSRRRSNADEYGYGHLALAFCSRQPVELANFQLCANMQPF
jgi:hypothetical protein